MIFYKYSLTKYTSILRICVRNNSVDESRATSVLDSG